MIQRSLHSRLQDYCACFVESDLETELERFVANHGQSTDLVDDIESALKLLALSILTGIERRADRISLSPTQISLLGDSRGLLATFPAKLVGRACDIIGGLSGVNGKKAQGRISLGLRGDEILLDVRSKAADPKTELVINLPSF